MKIERPRKVIQFNIPQLLVRLAPQPKKYLEAGRGTGKSTALGDDIQEVAHLFPRGTGAISGESFKQILTNTLPSTIKGLGIMGYEKDVHYVVGKRFPKSWKIPEAFEPPHDYTHYIHFYTGFGIHLISQDRGEGHRGFNLDYWWGDEAALQNNDLLNKVLRAANRGNRDKFGHIRKHHGEFCVSSVALTEKGKWFTKMEEEARKDPKNIFFLSAPSEYNRHNLGDDWFRQMKRTMPTQLYNAEILNIRPGKIEGCFYPKLTANHYYTNNNNDYLDSLNYEVTGKLDCRADGDLDPDAPLYVSVDWGASINSMVVAQQQGNEFRFIKNFFVLSPDILDNLFLDEFLPYYKYHRCRDIFFFYDRNGNSRKDNSVETNVQKGLRLLRDNGWDATPMTQGLDPFHKDKFDLWNVLLAHTDPRAPHILINKENCKNLIISMENAPVTDTDKGIKKDKRSERSTIIPQEEATHLSDAADILVWGMFGFLIDESAPRYTDAQVI